MHTARAPSASALAMSVPRRKPLSTRTGMRPPTVSTISGKASIVARPISPKRPPWSAGERVGDLPFVRRIEVEPHRSAACGDRVLDRGRGAGRQELQVVAGLCRLGDGDLAVRMKGAVAAGRGDGDRAVVARAEE